MKTYYVAGTLEDGEFIVQENQNWANDLTLSGPDSHENEVGSCVPLTTYQWEARGYRQISKAEAENLLSDAGFSDLSYTEWFDDDE